MKKKNKDKQLLETPFGTVRMAKKDAKRIKKAIVELQRTTESLTRKDIGDWRQAWQLAINVDSPNRKPLYDIYRDVDVDLHLSGCIQQREGFVLARSFKLVNESGEEDKEAAKYFNKPWFKQLMKLALDANYWGHSLIELGNIITVPDASAEGTMSYDGVKLINRKHVIPEYARVIRNLSEDWHSGIDYHDPAFSDWLIEVGGPYDLGLYLKAATQTIPKKNALAFWDTFAEIFGMPMRIAKTSTRDDKERARMEKMMSDMGTEGWGIFQEGTEIEVVESTKGDAFNVYDKRIDRANSELSKLVIGQTMTIEDGSSLSQSETHLEVFNNLIDADCDMLRDIINSQLIPRMIKHGFPIRGLQFEWDDSVDYTPEQQKAFEEMLLNNFEVDPKYFVEKYNVPVGERRQQPTPVLRGSASESNAPSGSPAGKNSNQLQNPFFD